MANLLESIFCHLLGDYVLQTDFLAKTKGTNWYHLIVHCFLYVFPFYVCYGADYRLAILGCSHFITDTLKARYKQIGYVVDQIVHIAVFVILYVF